MPYDVTTGLTTSGSNSDQIEALLERLSQEYTPDEYTAERMGPSDFEKISEDPQLRAAQMAALNQLLGLSKEGFSAQDRSALQLAMDDASMANRQSREALAANARQRGIGGSGLDMARQMMNEQGGASDRNRAGVGLGLAARDRALQALTGSAQLGGQIRGQDYGVASDRARARDMINQFNVGNMNQARMFNIGTGMDAEQMRRAGLSGLLNYYQGQRGQNMNMAGNVFSTLGGLAGSAIDAYGGGGNQGNRGGGGRPYNPGGVWGG